MFTVSGLGFVKIPCKDVCMCVSVVSVCGMYVYMCMYT